jgi:transposase-like protein
MRMPPDQIATALNLLYEGLSLSEIGRSVAQIYNVSPPADSTIYEWVSRFTQQAILKAANYKALTGTLWAADETVLDVAGGRTKAGAENTIRFWDVIDEKTRFLLASHMSRTRTIKDAQMLFTQANGRSLVVPKHIITDKLSAYLDGIERFHGTLKQRTKVMRGLRNPTTAKIVLDGWLIHYNYFRPHEGLRGKTPAEAAEIRFPYKSWQDIIVR